MKKLKLIIVLLFLLSVFIPNISISYTWPIYKVGSYFEFMYIHDLDTIRYSGRVVSDTTINNLSYHVLRIFNEPFMGTYNQYYYYDTINNVLYDKGGYTIPGCFDIDPKQKIVGFNWPKGYIFNTCFDTMNTIFKRSFVNDTGTFSNIFNSGIPLKVIQRKDTVGSPIWGKRLSVYSEMFGFLSYSQDYGYPFGGGPYSIVLKGAIIDSVRYGSIILGVEQTSSEIPDKFTLKQNYPNPFNPITKIKFDIPLDSRFRGNDKVVLKVYDVMGREVQTLVNERLQPGTYEASFDGSMLNSGVYFYKLVKGNFNETKKMLLIK